MSVLSDEQFLAKYATEFDFVHSETGCEVRAHYAGLRAVAEAAIAADRAARAEPVAFALIEPSGHVTAVRIDREQLESTYMVPGEELTPLYAAAPVVPKKIDCIDTDYKYACGWNDCRDAMLATAPSQDKCCENCHKCLRGVMENGLLVTSQRMIFCPACHNKRCPKASDHNLKCTNSNEPGQAGSIYTGGPAIKNKQELTDLQKDAANLLFALQDAWHYVHGWCTINSVKTRVQDLLRKYGDFSNSQKSVELTDEELKRIPVFYNADSGEIDEVSTFRAVISEHENKKRKSL